MNDAAFQQLLGLEANLQKAQTFLVTKDSVVPQTSLLQSHLELLTVSSQTNSSSITIEEVESLFARDTPADLTLTCIKCHHNLYSSDEDAVEGKHSEQLQPCCRSVKEFKFNEMEISFWWFLINSYSQCILTLPNYTRFMIGNYGIPTKLRDRVWGVLTQASNSSGEVDDYLQTLYESLNKDISPDFKIITNDVNRTYPELSMFNEYSIKVKFEKVLNGYSIFDSDMGYCQGLQFIVAPLLFHYEGDELKTFNSLVKLFEINKLRSIYNNEMSDLNLWFFQFEQILSKNSPQLHEHFINLAIDFKLFLSQWFLSFYSITMPFNFLVRMFDLMLFEGVQPTLLRVGLVILQTNEKLLSTIDDPELIYQHLLSENCWGCFANNVESFMQNILELPVNDFSTDHLKLLGDEYNSKVDSTQVAKNKSMFEKLVNTLSNLKNSTTESILSNSSKDDDSIKSNSIFSTNLNNLSTLSFNTIPSVAAKDKSEITEDVELLAKMYQLCLEKGISQDEPVLNKVRDRLSSLF